MNMENAILVCMIDIDEEDQGAARFTLHKGGAEEPSIEIESRRHFNIGNKKPYHPANQHRRPHAMPSTDDLAPFPNK